MIWNPVMQEDIDKIERVQISFIAKIRGLEEVNYHKRLEILKMYSLERRDILHYQCMATDQGQKKITYWAFKQVRQEDGDV